MQFTYRAEYSPHLFLTAEKRNKLYKVAGIDLLRNYCLHSKDAWIYPGVFWLQKCMFWSPSPSLPPFLSYPLLLQNIRNLEGNKVAIASFRSPNCNNFKKRFGESRIIFFKCTESQVFFSLHLQKEGLNIGYRLIQLEAEFCTASLCYWKIREDIICDICVMVLLFKMCWRRNTRFSK